MDIVPEVIPTPKSNSDDVTMRSPHGLRSGELGKREKPSFVPLRKSPPRFLICLLQMLNYQVGEECSLTSCHLVTKIMRGKDKESFLRELEVLHLRKENSCISIEANTVSLNLLVAEARIPLTN